MTRPLIAKEAKHTAKVFVYLPTAQRDALYRAATERGISVSALAAQAIGQYLGTAQGHCTVDVEALAAAISRRACVVSKN